MLSAHKQREFFLLVVEKQTTQCWSWVGQFDGDLRPVFGGEKAYRVMYELRVGRIPDAWHVHHKCNNSSCVNPRHLIALPEHAHRAVHAQPHRAKEIYETDWTKDDPILQERLRREAAAAAARLEAECRRLEQQELLRRTQERSKEFDRLFSGFWRLRNQRRLRGQAIKSDEALDALRSAYLSRKFSDDHLQFFCDTYQGSDEDMIPALLRSPKPNAIQLAGVKIKDFCYSVFSCVLFVGLAMGFVFIVQALFFRPDLQTAFFWAIGMLVLTIFIGYRNRGQNRGS